MPDLFLKFTTSMAALFTSLIGLVGAVHDFAPVLGSQAFFSHPGRGAVQVLIVVFGAMTIYRLWSGAMLGAFLEAGTLAGAMALIPLGSIAVLHHTEVAVTSGDIEWYVPLAGLALICQGFLTLMVFWRPGLAEA